MRIISDHCAAALQASVLAACAEATRYLRQPALYVELPLDCFHPTYYKRCTCVCLAGASFRSSSDVDDFRQPVLDLVYSAFQQHARHLTVLRSVAARLPDELLVETFTHLSVDDKIRAATVCHRWRAVSLGSPRRLWTAIPAPLDDLDGWAALLDRAQNAPVSLERIHIDKRNFAEVFFILENHINHVRSLELVRPIGWTYDDDHDVDESWSTYLDKLLELPAPELEHISVVHQENRRQPLPVLAAPKLRSVQLTNFNLSCLAPSAASPTLRSLVIDVLSDTYLRNIGIDALPGKEFSIRDWQILSSFPALEVLAVRLGKQLDCQGAPHLLLKLPRSLKRLHLVISGGIFRLLVNSLIGNIGHVPHWEICLKVICPTFEEILPLLPSSFESVAFDYWDQICFMITEPNGHQRILRNVEPDATWLRMLSDVERLCFSVRAEGSPVPPALIDSSLTFAVLQELTFDASGLRYVPPSGAHSLEWPYGPCPLLHTVRVRAYRHHALLWPDSVVVVLARVMNFTTSRRLSLLDFDNVELISEPDADVLSPLRELAETVTMRNDGEIWPECHAAWNKGWDGLLEDDIA